jgi:hypothetical protein
MLIGKRQGLDLQELWLSQQTVDKDAKDMSGQLGMAPGDQNPKGVRMVFLDLKLLGQLSIDRLSHLPNGFEQMLDFWRNLFLLITVGQSWQAHPVLLQQFSRFFDTDVAFIAQDVQVGMFAQQFEADFQIDGIGRSQHKIENETTHGDQQMQLIAQNGLFLEGPSQAWPHELANLRWNWASHRTAPPAPAGCR